MARPIFSVALFAMAGCTISQTVDRLDERCPPPAFGRPGWVRTCAGVGAWTGAIVGGAASIVLLPVTWPISLLASDGLGEMSQEEFLFFPASTCASVGHALLGTPPDVLDHVFRRAWQSQPAPVDTYELMPMMQPELPPVAPAHGGGEPK
jgi:hypothetical protein